MDAGWQGILCDAATGNVISINVAGKGLEGTIPDSIRKCHGLHAAIPADYSMLPRLVLNDGWQMPSVLCRGTCTAGAQLLAQHECNTLSSTKSGCDHAGNFTDLQLLDISSNSFTGSLPDTAAFAKLRTIDARNNPSLQGGLPAPAAPCALTHILLPNCNFSGETGKMHCIVEAARQGS
jgi:hypothetical protein